MISSTTLKVLLDAGLSGETLTAVTAAFDADMENVCNLLRNSVTLSDAGSVTPAALRMRKMRENARISKGGPDSGEVVSERNSVTSQSVTSDNILSLSKGIEKEESKPVVIARGRKKYDEQYEEFWAAYPTDKGMSKSEAYKFWAKLDELDQQQAFFAIPMFKKWVTEQGATYRVVHACRYLSQRRFEGFTGPEPSPINLNAWTAEPGTAEWDAWEAYWLKTKGHKPPRNVRGNWTFPSQWPPQEQAA